MPVSFPSLTPVVDSVAPAIEKVGDRLGSTVGALLSSGVELAGDVASDVADFAGDLLPSRRRPSALRRLAPWVLVALAAAGVVYVLRRRREADAAGAVADD